MEPCFKPLVFLLFGLVSFSNLLFAQTKCSPGTAEMFDYRVGDQLTYNIISQDENGNHYGSLIYDVVAIVRSDKDIIVTWLNSTGGMEDVFQLTDSIGHPLNGCNGDTVLVSDTMLPQRFRLSTVEQGLVYRLKDTAGNQYKLITCRGRNLGDPDSADFYSFEDSKPLAFGCVSLVYRKGLGLYEYYDARYEFTWSAKFGRFTRGQDTLYEGRSSKIKESSRLPLRMFPNPANDEFTLILVHQDRLVACAYSIRLVVWFTTPSSAQEGMA